jgi:hypothetical protein
VAVFTYDSLKTPGKLFHNALPVAPTVFCRVIMIVILVKVIEQFNAIVSVADQLFPPVDGTPPHGLAAVYLEIILRNEAYNR